MRGPTVGEVVLRTSEREALGEDQEPPDVVALNEWLKGLAQPAFAPIQQHPVDAASGPAFKLTTTRFNLAKLLLAICVRPWRAPALVEVQVKAEGDQEFRTLRGIKAIVQAQSRARRGFDNWWQV
jgi:hypothetical protein